MGYCRRDFAVDGDGLCCDGIQQHHGYAATGVFVCECAAVCNVFAGDVLEAGYGEWRVYRAHFGDGCGGAASWHDAADRGASGAAWRMDRDCASLSERHGAELLDGDLGFLDELCGNDCRQFVWAA